MCGCSPTHAVGSPRGGSWNNNPPNLRASNRNRNEPGRRNDNNGFRCAQSSQGPQGSLPPGAEETAPWSYRLP
jgi:hypothetical protein